MADGSDEYAALRALARAGRLVSLRTGWLATELFAITGSAAILAVAVAKAQEGTERAALETTAGGTTVSVTVAAAMVTVAKVQERTGRAADEATVRVITAAVTKCAAARCAVVLLVVMAMARRMARTFAVVVTEHERQSGSRQTRYTH